MSVQEIFLESLDFSLGRFNTSYVSVQASRKIDTVLVGFGFNTSYVSVQAK